VPGLGDCSFFLVQRASRVVARAYDRALKPAGLTANQFNMLCMLYWTSGHPRLTSFGALAKMVGMDPTTLHRDVKPLLARGLARRAADLDDSRFRRLFITHKGRVKLRRTVPMWQGAQSRMELRLGANATSALTSSLGMPPPGCRNNCCGSGPIGRSRLAFLSTPPPKSGYKEPEASRRGGEPCVA
jgi:DNA-binding MarR family transcriptional regulator